MLSRQNQRLVFASYIERRISALDLVDDLGNSRDRGCLVDYMPEAGRTL